jgi:hypothetical protein
MNKQIKELFEQCKTLNWSQFDPSYDYEMFADLIVRECIDICNNNTVPGANKSAVDCYYAIREHFNIKD